MSLLTTTPTGSGATDVLPEDEAQDTADEDSTVHSQQQQEYRDSSDPNDPLFHTTHSSTEQVDDEKIRTRSSEAATENEEPVQEQQQQPQQEKETNRPSSSSSHHRMETLEIETPDIPTSPSRDDDEDDDEHHNDLTGLLTASNKSKSSGAKDATRMGSCCCCCCCLEPWQKVGNMTIFWPSRFEKTGWGIAGPHWFGPPCVLALIALASYHLIVVVSWDNKDHPRRPLTALTCTLLALVTTYYLIQAAYRDPGVVRKSSNGDPNNDPEASPPPRGYLWCDFCRNYQPPGGAHCPQCGVCVAGFDHHCVWMGTCIGRQNFLPFVRFNLAWLIYLLYAVVWVSIIVPLLNKYQHQQQSAPDQEDLLRVTQ